MTGFVVVNKAVGVSSAREVGIIKRITNTPCGHLGTLDPMASGVLPIAIGNAARLFDYFLDKRKIYEATFDFGQDSDTLDATGRITATGGYIPDESEIKQIIPSLCGEIMQVPPAYSAKNVDGKRGYQLARAGIEFELPPKKVNIYSIELKEKVSENSFSFIIECGGGTYIRSIARDMGKRLGTCAIMSALVRVRSGCFTIDNAVKTDELTSENIENHVIKTESVLPYESIKPSVSDAKKLFNGLAVQTDLTDGIYKIFKTDGSFYGLAEVKQNILKVRTKLC